jgi:hypothetical protein
MPALLSQLFFWLSRFEDGLERVLYFVGVLSKHTVSLFKSRGETEFLAVQFKAFAGQFQFFEADLLLFGGEQPFRGGVKVVMALSGTGDELEELLSESRIAGTLEESKLFGVQVRHASQREVVTIPEELLALIKAAERRNVSLDAETLRLWRGDVVQDFIDRERFHPGEELILLFV